MRCLAQGAVARQDADAKDSDLAAKNAMVASARANLARLEAMNRFKRLVAPFDGIVTSRAVDVGALVLVGTPGATPLFTVADQKKLRIYVRVPQTDAGAIQPGMTATFTVPEYAGPQFHRDPGRQRRCGRQRQRHPAPAIPGRQ